MVLDDSRVSIYLIVLCKVCLEKLLPPLSLWQRTEILVQIGFITTLLNLAYNHYIFQFLCQCVLIEASSFPTCFPFIFLSRT